jgi:hypothetical protein
MDSNQVGVAGSPYRDKKVVSDNIAFSCAASTIEVDFYESSTNNCNSRQQRRWKTVKTEKKTYLQTWRSLVAEMAETRIREKG